MMVNFNQIIQMDKEQSIQKMEIFIKDCSKWVKNLDMEN